MNQKKLLHLIAELCCPIALFYTAAQLMQRKWFWMVSCKLDAVVTTEWHYKDSQKKLWPHKIQQTLSFHACDYGGAWLSRRDPDQCKLKKLSLLSSETFLAVLCQCCWSSIVLLKLQEYFEGILVFWRVCWEYYEGSSNTKALFCTNEKNYHDHAEDRNTRLTEIVEQFFNNFGNRNVTPDSTLLFIPRQNLKINTRVATLYVTVYNPY